MLSPNRRPMHRMGSAGFWRSCTPIVVCASRLEPAPSTRTIHLLTNRSCGAERHSRGRSPLQKKWILPRWGRFLLDEVKTVESGTLAPGELADAILPSESRSASKSHRFSRFSRTDPARRPTTICERISKGSLSAYWTQMDPDFPKGVWATD